MCRSVPQMPVRSTRINTSLMPIDGSGTSSSHKPGFAFFLTSAFILRAGVSPGMGWPRHGGHCLNSHIIELMSWILNTNASRMQTGKIRVKSGNDAEELNRGDSASYRADVPHAIVNIGKSQALVFLVDIYR